MASPRTKAKDGNVAIEDSELAGYALWAMPDQRSYDILGTVIMDFSERYGTPFFDPHISILGELGDEESVLQARARMLSGKIRQYPVTLEGVAHSEDYYRCIYAPANKSPEVMTIRTLAEEIFWAKPKPYAPHLSVIYGTLLPEDRIKVITGMDGQLDLTFTAESLRLMKVDGQPQDWRMIGEYPLMK